MNSDSGDIVAFNQFYIPDIQETIDIRADYFNWIQNQVRIVSYDWYPGLTHDGVIPSCFTTKPRFQCVIPREMDPFHWSI